MKATPIHARNFYSLGRYSITTPRGRVIDGPPTGTYWRISEENFIKMDQDNRIWWGQSGNGIPAQKRFLSEVRQGVTPNTFGLFQRLVTMVKPKMNLEVCYQPKKIYF